MSTRDKLLSQIKAFCDAQGMKPSTLTKQVANDGGFFNRLSDGKDCNTGTFDRFQKHFIEHGHDPDELARAGTARNRETAA